jgi:hypothetical protein
MDEKFLNRKFMNTLNLFIDFSLVENSDEVKQLLNTYALPIGSSSLKRKGKSNISLNAYVGITGGYETVFGNTNENSFNLGLTAPIGVAFSHRYKPGAFISSGSIFVGLLDLGSLVNASFKDEVEIESDLSFQQFFVPTLGYFFNINNSPFSIGASGSYHFDSRTFQNSSIREEGLNAVRVNLSFLVDIPLFTLKHNGNGPDSKDKKKDKR